MAPQGYLGSGDYYTKKMNEVINRIKSENPEIFKSPCSPEDENSTSWVRCIDDTVLWADSSTNKSLHKCATKLFSYQMSEGYESLFRVSEPISIHDADQNKGGAGINMAPAPVYKRLGLDGAGYS